MAPEVADSAVVLGTETAVGRTNGRDRAGLEHCTTFVPVPVPSPDPAQNWSERFACHHETSKLSSWVQVALRWW